MYFSIICGNQKRKRKGLSSATTVLYIILPLPISFRNVIFYCCATHFTVLKSSPAEWYDFRILPLYYLILYTIINSHTTYIDLNKNPSHYNTRLSIGHTTLADGLCGRVPLHSIPYVYVICIHVRYNIYRLQSDTFIADSLF